MYEYNYTCCYPKIKKAKKKNYPQSGLDSSQLMNVQQYERRKNDRTYYNRTDLAFYQNGLDLMNVTANYNFNYWDGHCWRPNHNSLRQYRSVPYSFYPCPDCKIVPGTKERECKKLECKNCKSLVVESNNNTDDKKNTHCHTFPDCGNLQEVTKCDSLVN